jgi:hypothetical protein
MMRGVLHSLFVITLLGGIAAADPGDPMPAEQAPKAADPAPKAADSKFEVKKDEGAQTEKSAKTSKHKAKQARKHKTHKHKSKHHKAKKAAASGA